MKSVYTDAGGMFDVCQTGNRYYLTVIVGGIGMFPVQREMTDEMVAAYLDDPQRLTWWVDKIRREDVEGGLSECGSRRWS